MSYGSIKVVALPVICCALFFVSACASFPKESANALAKTGRSSMGSLAKYYVETLEIVQLSTRENMLREALEIEAGICKQPDGAAMCDADRARLAQSYQDRANATLNLEQALRAREKMARSAEQLYQAYGEMASDSFEEDAEKASSSMAASLQTITTTPIQGAAISKTMRSLAGAYESNQLLHSEAMLEDTATAIRDQFIDEAPLWKTQYEGYFTDYRQNTRSLLKGDYASKSDLGPDVLAARGLKPGAQHLNANPATLYLLAEYRAEDATRSRRLAMKAGEQAETSLKALVEAHNQTERPGALDAAITSATRLATIIEAIEEQESKETKSNSEGDR